MPLRKTKKFITENSFAILLFFLVFIPALVYGIRQGFYWDDWSQLLLHEKYGDAMFREYFSYDRPFSWWTHALFFPLCGNSPALWHLLFALIRFFCIWFTFRVFGRLFGPSNRFVRLAAVLTAVCPLFTQYSISVAYSQHFTDYLLFIISFDILFRAAEQRCGWKKYALYALSLALTVAHLSVTEYFSFLELMKLSVIAIKKNEKDGLFDEVLILSGTFISFVGFVVVRQSISVWNPNFNANKAVLFDLLHDSLTQGVVSTAKNVIYDFAYLAKGFWSGVFSLDKTMLLTKTNGMIIFISLIFAVVSVKIIKRNPEQENSKKRINPTFFSFFWIVLGTAPFWVMNENYLHSGDPYHADRCFLAAVPGFCLLISYVVSVLFTRKGYIAASAMLIFLFSSSFLLTEQKAIFEKEKQNNFYWQIAERIPGLKRKTALVSDKPFFPEDGNFATSSALNLIYSGSGNDLNLWMFGTQGKMYSPENQYYSMNKRNYSFTSTDSIYVLPNNRYGNCAWVLTKDDVLAPHLTETEKSWAAAADLSMIDADSAAQLIDGTVFGARPDNWCMYYQSAARLQQQENWEEISELYDRVREKGFDPYDIRSNSPFEWVPFIRALLRVDRVGDAEEIMEKCLTVDYKYREMFENIRNDS
ncbi:MAG: glycosyltransferase family 39 protein [Anaerolineaceae bacterium]|nr:glycosyltransferase family 39 protein [Anaerolineaceae bacterium]